ncbi:putative transmembrane protein [Phytophthora cinnamomi]|uniref:putative transmembrane protein n=1 Tax=Phytophthora cinnamomi TaxID=4785 RepID=UPI00355A6075|nr:putative transmembrane protein [Phytophthora cinnamomi]
MLYLLACNEDAAEAFLNLPMSGDDMTNIHMPPYCAMVNRTLDYYCQSFPLEDESSDEYVYQSLKVVTGSMDEMSPSAYSLLGNNDQGASTDRRDSKSNSGSSNTVLFFIDSCETVGGQDGILRSCLNHPPGSNYAPAFNQSPKDNTPCFYCPGNYPSSYMSQISRVAEDEGCITSLALPPTLRGTVLMNLCNSKGDCLGKTTSFETIFYGLSSLVWGATAFVWIVHIRAAARGAVVELQNKMKLVPVTQMCYSLFTFVDLYADDKVVGTPRSLIQNVAVLAQLVALAVFAEVVIVIAKGWKITRPALHPREVPWIRFVTLSWAGSYAVLKYTGDKQLLVVIVWGLSWASVVFMVWYNSAFNLNMLKYQLALVRQLNLDPQLTPVYIKFMLFRRFRALLAVYITFSCIFGIVDLVYDATENSSAWTSLLRDEGLTLLLFVALGYTFRCRRFARLLQPSAASNPQLNGSTIRSTDQGAMHRGSILPEPVPLEHEEPPMRKSTIVVLNPDRAPSLATKFELIEVKPQRPPKSTADS